MAYSGITRQLGFAAALAFATSNAAGAEEVTEIRLLEMGGIAGDAVQAAYVDPFVRKTNINLVRENPASLGKIKAMVESGNPTADMVLVTDGWLAQAKEEGLLEPLDWEAIDPAPIMPGARDDYAIGWSYASAVMAWHTDARTPETWADFWNAADFPGKRSLPDNPSIVLPIALIADGVAMDELYPLDLDRAFKKLEEIRPAVSVWWTSAGQSAQLLIDKEVSYGITYNGRVYGKPNVDFTFNQAYLELSWWGVPKGVSPERKLAAMKFFHETTLPENEAVFMEMVPYSGASTELDALLPEEKRADFPTTAGNAELQWTADRAEWQKVASEAEKRWQQFKLGL
ncbi:extracellular solute-binding protein [Sulfitobacter sp. G21635-S1]|uniref:extracellular solute-binding protein n=1 Tax=Sulfitobacter sp. G21635-S1 TaxID=3014043 RepID=UPI0022AEC5C0|nr:extracellular solute-binding protein [Sulfitobacter sp. G21635-S1]MCZ4254293.1 extracellular solute-binding protein [Sulfitobacter sp. G21635-S1]